MFQFGVSGLMIGLAIIAFGGAMVGFVLFWRKRSNPVDLPEDLPKLERILIDEQAFLSQQKHIRRELKSELQNAPASERPAFRGRLEAVDQRLAAPDWALDQAQSRADRLVELLYVHAENLPPQLSTDAIQRLSQAEFGRLDAAFTTLQQQPGLPAETQVGLAVARAEIAELLIDWTAAFKHYAQAARAQSVPAVMLKVLEYARRTGEQDAAQKAGSELVALVGKSQEIDATQSVYVLQEHAETLRGLGNLSDAEFHLRRALEIERNHLSDRGAAFATSLKTLAELLELQGQAEEAEDFYRQAIEAASAEGGKSHPDFATHISNLASFLRSEDRFDEAEPLYRQALEVTREVLGRNHPNYAARLNNLALLLDKTGRAAEAEPFFREALEVLSETLGEDHPTTLTCRENLELAVQEQKAAS